LLKKREPIKDLVRGVDVERRSITAREGLERDSAAVERASWCGVMERARG